MLEALRDPFVQFVVGALLTLATLIVGVIGLRAFRNRKGLSYKVIFNRRLLSVQEDLKGRVDISLDGQPVSDVRMTLLVLRNSGNIPIEESDYVRPVGFEFGEEAQILDAELVETKPTGMEVTLDWTTSYVLVVPDILNGGDALALQVLVSGGGEMTPVGRIVGVDEIIEQRDFDYGYIFIPANLLALVLLLVGAFLDAPDYYYFLIFGPLVLIVLSPILIEFLRKRTRHPFDNRY